MFGLKQRSTYEEIIKHVKSQEEQRVSLPNRVANIIHNSIKYQSFINEHLNDLEEQQNKAFKHNVLQNEIKKQKGVGNHEVNKSTPQQFNIAQDDDDGDYDTPDSNGNGNGNYLTPTPHSERDITDTISSVTSEEEKKKQDQLRSVTAKKHISHSIEGKMLEERVALNKEVTFGATTRVIYYNKFMKMWEEYENYKLGDNKDFILSLLDIKDRLKHFGEVVEEDKKEEKKRINEGIEALWEQYNEFKSVRKVLDLNYNTFHDIAMDSVLKGTDIVSAVQAVKTQTPASSSKDHILPTPKAKGKGRPINPNSVRQHQIRAKAEATPKPKGRPKKEKFTLPY